MKKLKPIYIIMPLIAALAAVSDQWTKAWVAGNMELHASRNLIPYIVGLTYTQNTGAAFSLFSWAGWLLPALSGLALLLIGWTIFRGWVTHPFALITLSMVFGGALGNMIDRIRLGYVTDMFELLFIRFAIFNVADIFITTGGALFCAYLLFFHEKSARRPERGDA